MEPKESPGNLESREIKNKRSGRAELKLFEANCRGMAFRGFITKPHLAFCNHKDGKGNPQEVSLGAS